MKNCFVVFVSLNLREKINFENFTSFCDFTILQLLLEPEWALSQ